MDLFRKIIFIGTMYNTYLATLTHVGKSLQFPVGISEMKIQRKYSCL